MRYTNLCEDLSQSFQTGVLAVVDQPKPNPIVEQPPGEETVVVPIKPKPPRKPKDKKKAAAMRKANLEKGQKTAKAILEVINDWALNPAASLGTVVDLKDCLELKGTKLSPDSIRDHIVKLAKDGSVFVERQILDPKNKYKPGKSLRGFMYTYLIGLNGDNGERGMHDFVITLFCDTYIQREKGRFIDFL